MFESFSLMCDEALEHVKRSDEALKAAQAAMLAGTLRGILRLGDGGVGSDAGDAKQFISQGACRAVGEEEEGR